jgi:predicted nucleotidyltransferase
VTPLRAALERDNRIAYALLFGSTARSTAHAGSDLDVAIGLIASDDLDDLLALCQQLARRAESE